MKKCVLLLTISLISCLVLSCSSCDSCLEKSSTSYISEDSAFSYSVTSDSFIVSDIKSGEVVESYYIISEDSNWKSEDAFIAYERIDTNDIKEHMLLIYPNVNGNHYEYFIRMDNKVTRAYKITK